MNIGIVVDNDLNNDKRVMREIEILKEAGHTISVLCFRSDNRSYSDIEGINIFRIRISRNIKNVLFFFLNTVPAYEWFWSCRIGKFISQKGIDILHVHDLFLAKAGRSGIIKSGKNVPMILDLHENYPYAVTTYNWTKGFLRNMIARPSLWRKKEKEYLHYADHIIVLSNDFRDLLIQRYPSLLKKHFTALPNVPDLLQAEQKGIIPAKTVFGKGSVVMLYFGVVAERRGIFDVLDVLGQMANYEHPVAFLIIGPVDKKDKQPFLKEINSEHLRNRIQYIPWIDMTELAAYLAVSDICIAPFHKNPQHESGVANKIFDYMLGKKPLIVSDCKPQAAIIENFNCGIVYRNNQELMKAIETLSADPQLRKKMGENGYKAIISHYNMDLIKGNLNGLYSEFQAAYL
jgi:glycosyltransferase involved in cell wall biosynthesis